MRICYISSMFPTKRAPHNGVFITRRIEALKELGINVDAYALVREESFLVRLLRKITRKELKEVFSDVIYTDNSDIIYRTIKIKLNFVEFIINFLTCENYYAWKAARTCDRDISDAFDLVHAHWLFPTGKAAIIFAKKKHVPVFVTCHGSDINYYMKLNRYRKSCQWTLLHADEVEFVSQRLMDTAKMLGGEWKAAHVLPNGIVNHRLNFSKQKQHVIGFVGNLIDVKRVDCFPELFRRLHCKYHDLTFVIVGDGERGDWLKKQLNGLPVVFTGRVSQDQVLDEMEKMMLMILPSRNEGWPCVVLEAYSCGTPVIGSSCGGIPEAVDDENFIVADNKDLKIFTDELYIKISDYLDNKIPFDQQKLIEKSNNFKWNRLQSIEMGFYNNYVKD